MATGRAELESRLRQGVEIAREAGDLTMRFVRSDLEVDRKADNSPVTRADREAEQLVRRRIEERFPSDGCLGEEFGATDGTNSYRWVVDPIDGTKSFISGVPLFGTLLALLRDDQPVLGIVYLPMLGECLYAANGSGAWLASGTAAPRQVRVASTTSLADGVLLLSELSGFDLTGARAAFEELHRRTWITRTWGDCYGYYLVATGRATVMLDPELKLWDAAPMLPILREAGGRYTDWQGRESGTSGSAIATNGLVHDEVLAVLQHDYRQ
ncbi:MAG: histidinol-phosphatase [Planctomycetota bacterium]|nr:histidinol-phosphatase [Planctomycetota bacterium]